MPDTNRCMTIEYFSDVLCVWAYAAQPRLDQLKQDFGEHVDLHYRFIPLFAAAQQRIADNWGEDDGLSAFNRHLQEVSESWDHLEVSERVWLDNPPTSSTTAHLYLKAVQLLQGNDLLPNEYPVFGVNRSAFEEMIWQIRQAFFRQARNVSDATILEEIISDLKLPRKSIKRLLNNGEAHAALHLDYELKESYQVIGSPTFIFNEGRQKLYGNVGYRIIKANIQELFHNPQHGEASWC